MDETLEVFTELRTHVIPWEEAQKEAKALDSETLGHRLRTINLESPLTRFQRRAYLAEAKERIRAAKSATGGHD